MPEYVEFFAREAAGDADGEAGAGEGVAADKTFGQAELAAERADFVLEQFAQRLDELHVHALGQAADIVVDLMVTDGPPEKETLSITSG